MLLHAILQNIKHLLLAYRQPWIKAFIILKHKGTQNLYANRYSLLSYKERTLDVISIKLKFFFFLSYFVQVMGQWKLRSENLAASFAEVMELKKKFHYFSIKHVYRVCLQQYLSLLICVFMFGMWMLFQLLAIFCLSLYCMHIHFAPFVCLMNI